MPIRGRRMLESPIDRNPARPPRLPINLLGPRNMPRIIEAIEILPRENVPVAIQESALQVRRQRAQRLQIIFVRGVNRVVADARGNEFVIARIVRFRRVHAGRGLLVNPQRLYPSVADVAGVGGTGHARKRARHGTSVAAREELPLAESEERELVNADEKKFRALILVHVVFVLAVAEARGGIIQPGDQVFRFVVALVKLARNIAAKIKQQRLFQFRKSPAQQQRVRGAMFVGLQDRFHQQRFRFSRAGCPTEEAILRGRPVKSALLGEGLVVRAEIEGNDIAGFVRTFIRSRIARRALLCQAWARGIRARCVLRSFASGALGFVIHKTLNAGCDGGHGVRDCARFVAGRTAIAVGAGRNVARSR